MSQKEEKSKKEEQGKPRREMAGTKCAAAPRKPLGAAQRSPARRVGPAEIASAKTKLKEAAEEAARANDPELGSEPGSELSRSFSTGEAAGRAFYKSLSDEDLVEMLKEETRRLGHVPAQKEVFWIYRNYLRMRFDKWPYALKKAGLSTKAGKGGMTVEKMEERSRRYEELMDMIRAKAKELGRPPHMFEMEDILKELKGWFMTWAEVLDAAGIDRNWQKKEVLYKVKQFTPEEEELLRELRALAKRLGRAPLRNEVSDELRRKLNRRCGTWRNTLYQIGLEPIAKISPFGNTYLARGREQQKKHKDILENSLYKLVDPDKQTLEMLKEVKAIAEELGRPPIKSEIPSRTYSCLIKKCSTYRNLLYQVGLTPLDKSATVQVQAKLREKGKKSPEAE